VAKKMSRKFQRGSKEIKTRKQGQSEEQLEIELEQARAKVSNKLCSMFLGSNLLIYIMFLLLIQGDALIPEQGTAAILPKTRRPTFKQLVVNWLNRSNRNPAYVYAWAPSDIRWTRTLKINQMLADDNQPVGDGGEEGRGGRRKSGGEGDAAKN